MRTLTTIPPQILLYLIGVGLFVYYLKYPSSEVKAFVDAGKQTSEFLNFTPRDRIVLMTVR